MVKITNIKHKLYMPPIKKYEVYGKFPWKLVIQMLLAVLTASQIIYIVNRSTTYSYSQYTLWNKVFLNKDVQGSDTLIVNSYNIFSIESLGKYVKETVDNYYDINSRTIDNYKYHHKSDGTKEPPKLLVEYFDNEKALKRGYKIEYSLFVNNLGPFDLDDVQEFIGFVKNFQLKFSLIHSLNSHIQLASDCYDWEITQFYEFSFRGAVKTSMGTRRTNCGGIYRNIVRNYIWINLLVIILAFSSLFLVIRYFQNRLEIIETITGISLGTTRAWEQLGLKDKLKLFNFWIVISILGNVCQIFGAVLSIFEPNNDMKVNETIMGFGCFFAWVGSVRFISKTSHSYTIVNTVSRGAPVILMYICGVVPIFMGYTFFAMCWFWQVGIYNNSYMSALANYAVVNGDSVYLFAFGEYSENSFVGQLYSYTFVVFFIWY